MPTVGVTRGWVEPCIDVRAALYALLEVLPRRVQLLIEECFPKFVGISTHSMVQDKVKRYANAFEQGGRETSFPWVGR